MQMLLKTEPPSNRSWYVIDRFGQPTSPESISFVVSLAVHIPSTSAHVGW
jgi:hypothetical protein